jgi:hypothetical protein
MPSPAPRPATVACARTPFLSVIAVSPSGVRSLSPYRKPVFVALQHGFPLQVPPFGAAASSTSQSVPPALSRTQSV